MTRPLFPPRNDLGAVLSNGNDLRLPPVFEPIVSHPMVDDFALRAHRQRARNQPPGIPPMYPLPMRNHPMWSGSNELGNELLFELDSTGRQTILKMVEWGMPQVWTVKLGLQVRDQDFGANDGLGIFGIIQAGAGGTVQEFEVDWHEGTTFSCNFNAITIIAGRPSSTNIPPNTFLRATVGVGESSRFAPTRSFFMTQIAPAATGERVRLPAFTSRLSLFNFNIAPSDIYAAGIRLNFYPGPTAAAPFYVVNAADLRATGNSMVLPGSYATYVDITNGSANAIGPAFVCELGV